MAGTCMIIPVATEGCHIKKSVVNGNMSRFPSFRTKKNPNVKNPMLNWQNSVSEKANTEIYSKHVIAIFLKITYIDELMIIKFCPFFR